MTEMMLINNYLSNQIKYFYFSTTRLQVINRETVMNEKQLNCGLNT